MKSGAHVECPGEEEREEVAAYANGADGEREGGGRGSAEGLNDESGEGVRREGRQRWTINHAAPAITDRLLPLLGKQTSSDKQGDPAFHCFTLFLRCDNVIARSGSKKEKEKYSVKSILLAQQP